jgi:malonyl-CoA/methylmalonyl-CoA synthetase
MMLLASAKFQDKAEEIIKEGTTNKPLVGVEKIKEGNQSAQQIKLVDFKGDNGGLMLYTSGTTSRPVSLYIMPIHADGFRKAFYFHSRH